MDAETEGLTIGGGLIVTGELHHPELDRLRAENAALKAEVALLLKELADSEKARRHAERWLR